MTSNTPITGATMAEDRAAQTEIVRKWIFDRFGKRIFHTSARELVDRLNAARSEGLPALVGEGVREELARIIKGIAERWIYRTAHKGPEHLCSGIAEEAATEVLALLSASPVQGGGKDHTALPPTRTDRTGPVPSEDR